MVREADNPDETPPAACRSAATPRQSLRLTLNGKSMEGKQFAEYRKRLGKTQRQMAQLIGTNLAYVDLHLPHLAALLVDESAEFVEHAELLVLATDVADQLDWEPLHTGEVIDLRRDLAVARCSVASSK